MKKKKRLKINIHLSNRWLYFFITLGILAIIAVGVYAATYSASGAGHPYTEISTCSANQILKMDSTGTDWTCGTDVDTDTDTRCDSSGRCSRVCIGTSCRTSWPAAARIGSLDGYCTARYNSYYSSWDSCSAYPPATCSSNQCSCNQAYGPSLPVITGTRTSGSYYTYYYYSCYNSAS